ncbi:MAG: DUF1453 family protein [Caulobacterales bacterium]|nr:DUF1453 family protein [Caulobacterales bacterium]
MSPEQYAPLIAIAVAVPLMLLRNRRPRTLRPRWMWVMPTLIVVMIGLGVWGSGLAPGVSHEPFGPLDYAVLALGLGLGAAAGWWRGKMTMIERHADGTLKAQASPIGLVLILALMLGRRILAAWLEPHAAGWGLNVLAVTDAFLLFVAAMIVVSRVEMWIRARRILAGHSDDHVERLP